MVENKIKCPRCGSEQLSAHGKEKDAVEAAAQVLLTGLKRLLTGTHWSGTGCLLCMSCGEVVGSPGAGGVSEEERGFYALTSAFFLGIFLVKNRLELLISFPFFALLFSWYLRIGLLKDSPVQGSEKLYTRKWFMLYVVFFSILLVTLMFVDIPWLKWFLRHTTFS